MASLTTAPQWHSATLHLETIYDFLYQALPSYICENMWTLWSTHGPCQLLIQNNSLINPLLTQNENCAPLTIESPSLSLPTCPRSPQCPRRRGVHAPKCQLTATPCHHFLALNLFYFLMYCHFFCFQAHVFCWHDVQLVYQFRILSVFMEVGTAGWAPLHGPMTQLITILSSHYLSLHLF